LTACTLVRQQRIVNGSSKTTNVSAVMLAANEAAAALQNSNKRPYQEISRATPTFEDEEPKTSHLLDNGDESSEEEDANVDTPLTPFSPPRKFPSDQKTIKCTYDGCTKTFNRPARLRAHLRSHTQERPFVCSYEGCDKSYLEEKHLKQHIKGSHTHEKSHQCEWEGCGKSFLTATRLRRHQDAHQGNERFKCTAYPPCAQTFRKHQTLQRHIRAEHLGLDPFVCSHVDPDTKEACNLGFDSAGALRKHEDRTHGALRFWCDECSTLEEDRRQGFRTQVELMRHIRTEHSNCIFCDLKCSSQAELERHIELQHSNGTGDIKIEHTPSTALPCTYFGCNKTFTKKSNLQAHIRGIHLGKRFSCSADPTVTFKDAELASWNGMDACGQDFSTKANLEDHIRTQHLDLPSKINSKRARVSKKAKLEEVVEEGAIGQLTGLGYETRQISCTVAGCEWRFMREYDLEQHLLSKHQAASTTVDTRGIEQPPNAKLLAEGRRPNRATASAMPDQTFQDIDWDWEMSTRNSERFWIGGDHDTVDSPAGDDIDSWAREEEEMRRLIGPLEAFNDNFDAQLDPALRGL
jgi:general transcription factor IIIA